MIFLCASFSKVVKYLIQKYIISMVSKNQIKLITGLVQKKNRIEQQLFIAEGKKVIEELLQSNFELESLFVTNENIFTTVSKNKINIYLFWK